MVCSAALSRSVTLVLVILGITQNGIAAIQILDGSRIVPAGGSVSLASVTKNATAPLKTLTIKNTGPGAINLGLAGSVTPTTDIVIVTNYATNQILAAGQSCSVTVQLKSATVGFKTGKLNLAGQKINAFGSVTNGEIVIDNLDPGFSLSGSWPTQSPG